MYPSLPVQEVGMTAKKKPLATLAKKQVSKSQAAKVKGGARRETSPAGSGKLAANHNQSLRLV